MLTFSREIKPNHLPEKSRLEENVSFYKLLCNQNKISELIISKKKSLVNYNDKQFHIDRKLKIHEPNNVSLIGHYKISSWTFWIGYRHKIVLADRVYEFKRLNPHIKKSIFKKSTWGQFKFKLSNENEFIIYTFRVDIPAISLGNIFMEKSFNGQIETNNSDNLVVTLGLLLIERTLRDEIFD